jgi:hypothetical protein
VEFWSETLSGVTEVEAALAAGSMERFLRTSADFLRERTPNKALGAEVLARAQAHAEGVTVSVILDLGVGEQDPEPSIESVLAQTHRPIELVVVGSQAALEDPRLAALRRSREAVFVVSGGAGAPGRMREAALIARGAYMAFLIPPAAFVPDKIAVQMQAMSAAGAVLSHTSYGTPQGVMRSGAFTGRVYPEIVGGCPVVLETVMAHRSLVAAGSVFGQRDAPLEASWIDIAARHDLLGLDEALTRLPHPAPARPGVRRALRSWLLNDELHRRQSTELRRFDEARSGFEPSSIPM